MDNIDSFLKKIAQIESNSGTNFNHQEIKTGPQKGQTAIGTYGLLPNTVDEVITRSKDPELKDLSNMDADQQKEYLEANPDKERLVARHLAEHVLEKQDGNQAKAAFAWNQGHNLSPEEVEKRKYQDSDYVQKFNKVAAKIHPEQMQEPQELKGVPGTPGTSALYQGADPSLLQSKFDTSGTKEGDRIRDNLENYSAREMMEKHFADQRAKTDLGLAKLRDLKKAAIDLGIPDDPASSYPGLSKLFAPADSMTKAYSHSGPLPTTPTINRIGGPLDISAADVAANVVDPINYIGPGAFGGIKVIGKIPKNPGFNKLKSMLQPAMERAEVLKNPYKYEPDLPINPARSQGIENAAAALDAEKQNQLSKAAARALGKTGEEDTDVIANAFKKRE